LLARTVPDTRDLELLISVFRHSGGGEVGLTFLWMTVGVFRIVALRTTSMNSADVGTGAMFWRPATDDMVARWMKGRQAYTLGL
jgi:hypothetical protein